MINATQCHKFYQFLLLFSYSLRGLFCTGSQQAHSVYFSMFFFVNCMRGFVTQYRGASQVAQENPPARQKTQETQGTLV